MMSLEGFKSSIDSTISSKSRSLLGADFGLSARRALLASEKKAVYDAVESLKGAAVRVEETRMIELFSMTQSDEEKSRLIQIRAVEDAYPFYGKISVENSSQKLEGNFAWAHPDLISQLGIDIGESLRVGESKFVIVDTVVDDTVSGVTASIAPRLYIGLDSLNRTGLIKAGSLAWHSSLFKISSFKDSELDRLLEKVFQKIDSPEVKVYTHKTASQQLAGLVSRLSDFLGLTSLVALFLAAMGTFFLMQSYFSSKTDQVAILMSLGLSPFKSFLFYLVQIGLLGFMSVMLAFLLSLFLVPVLGALVKELLPFEIDFFISPETVVAGFFVGVMGAVLICLPLLIQFVKIKPVKLLTGQIDLGGLNSVQTFLLSLPLLFLFLFLSVELSNSVKVGSFFSLFFFLVLSLLLFTSVVLFRNFRFRNVWFGTLSLQWALRDLNRKKGLTAVSFASIGIGVLLLNLIPQVQQTIAGDLLAPEKTSLPTFFMFDIQEEQVESFKKTVEGQGAALKNLSPAVRARLLSVNSLGFSKSIGKGTKAKLTREEEREQRFRNRGFNLSYRSELDPSERILEGRSFSGRYDESKDAPPEISIETRFAKRLGLEIGDLLEFEIDGLPIAGKIINTRSVKWSSFQPNFFIQFQPGALDLAPKTFVASVRTSVNSLEKKIELQNAIVSNLPNVSIVDVTKVMKRLLSIMDQMTWALKFMSFLCVFVGFVVVYSIAQHQTFKSRWDIGLYKALGAPFDVIRKQILWQFGLISTFASLLGILISFAASFLISVYMFETEWTLYAVTPLISFLMVVLITLVVTDFAVRKSLKTKTSELFM